MGSLEQRRYPASRIGSDPAINKPALLLKMPFAEFDTWGSSPPLVRVQLLSLSQVSAPPSHRKEN